MGVKGEASLNDCTGRGAKVIARVQKIGSRWVAACTLPPKLSDPDTTTSLSFSDLAEGIRKPAPNKPEFDDGCTVQELGFKQIITGPSRPAVELRIEHLKQFGAELIGDIEQRGEEWTAVVDTGGVDKSYRW